MTEKSPSGTHGGAYGEAGGEYRRALAALFVAHALNGVEFNGLPVGGAAAIVQTVGLETDAPVDDILVGLSSGRLYVQAKRTLRFGRPLQEAAEQWLRAIRDESFNRHRDFVAIGSGDISTPLKLAARALDRRRIDSTSTWTAKEREQVAKLQALLRRLGATDDETALVLSRAVFIEHKVEEDHEPDAETGRLLLDGHVVDKGEGGRAWRELLSAAGYAARLRIGQSVGGWLDELRRRGVPLTVDAERSRAAALESQHRAVDRYLDRLRERGETVDLTAVGAQLPPLPLKELDAEIKVRDPDDTERDGKDLLWAFRRRGRVLLTGLPGGGKSTSLRAVAGQWSQRRHWALPITVSLRRVAEKDRFRKRPLRDDLLDLAIELSAPEDRVQVRDALDHALTKGAAVLFLDGLDEAADRSLALASDINNLLGEIHPDTDVLLGTRDAAYSDARILKFRDLVLNRPREADRTVHEVLAAIALQRDIQNSDSWVDHRAAWVARTLELDSQLSETPLLPVLLALLAAETDAQSLPTTRARILTDVIRGVVERYEINRELELAALPKGHEAEALIGAYPRIAAALASVDGAAPRSSLAAALLPYLRDDWGLPPAPARKTAEEILRFWDESGIFVARGNEKTTSPRLQLFLEIGQALDAAARPADEAPTFVARLAPHADRHETLVLAAGLSGAIADAFIAHAVELDDEPLVLAAATAVAQGGRPGDARLRQLITELIALMRPGDDEAWRVFNTLVLMSVPEDLQEHVLTALDALGSEHAAVGRALAALEWDYSGERRAEALEAGLRVPELPRLARRRPREGRYADLRDLAVDQAFMRVKRSAAAELLPQQPALAQLVANAMQHASFGTVAELTDVLIRNGHEEFAFQTRRKLFSLSSDAARRFADQFGDIETEVERTLETIAALAPPAELTLAQTRRLDELASFVETLDLNNGTAWVRSERLEELRETWYRLIATLGGFDNAVLAAEAQLVQFELNADGTDSHAAFFSLFDAAEEAPLLHWDGVPDRNAGRDLAVHMLGGRWALARVSAKALANHPDREGTAKEVERRLPAIPRESKRAAVWAALKLADDVRSAQDRLATHHDEAVRESVASLIRLTDGHSPTEHGRALASDQERKVQLAALERFKDEVEEPSQELLSLLERLAEAPPQPFACYRCGTPNEADRDSCRSCNVVTEKPPEKAQELLKAFRDRLAGKSPDGLGAIG